jgi:hypothetical protein
MNKLRYTPTIMGIVRIIWQYDGDLMGRLNGEIAGI